MRLLTNRTFRRWAEKEGLTNVDLCHALAEIEAGLIDADLGGGVIKKRIALAGRGKSAGARTLLVYRAAERAVFVYGFSKSDKANITSIELKALKNLASELLSYNEGIVDQLVRSGVFTEVKIDG
ncbi:type II toxin-antitoxin system RelE/ParE family toxin [Rheinheimera soli]|uniref:type II toxin-antitoxin system RelE/ParE family toxin n=1 Tax=Rheinheimera soli TaxID=443616 RepID=UPI001E490A7D|nr:type II toxin-antitoxin system RelE/ParE family toxin [Rheinheimera soli]